MSSSPLHRIVVGLSGGVDSAVTAWLLKRAGHEVVGIYMKNWEEDDDDEYCSSRQDFLDAASVTGVPWKVNAALPANATWAPTQAPSAAARCGASQPASTRPTRMA